MIINEIEQFNKNIPSNILVYLNERGITQEIIDKYKIGWNGKMIVIPSFSVKGNLLVVKLRKSPFDLSEQTPKYLFDVGKADIFGYDSIVGADKITICEGEFDCILLKEKGIRAITSMSGASTFKKEWISECLSKIKDFYIVFDRDKAGDAGANKLAQNLFNLLGNVNVHKITLPDIVGDAGDITDYFIKHKGSVDDLYSKYAEKVKKVEIKLKPVYIESDNGELKNEIERAKSYPIQRLLRGEPQKASAGVLFYTSPFREEQVPSFAVYEKSNSYYDFGSGKGGDSINFVMDLYKLDFKESIKFIINNLQTNTNI